LVDLYILNKRAKQQITVPLMPIAWSSALDFFALEINGWQKYLRCEGKDIRDY